MMVVPKSIAKIYYTDDWASLKRDWEISQQLNKGFSTADFEPWIFYKEDFILHTTVFH